MHERRAAGVIEIVEPQSPRHHWPLSGADALRDALLDAYAAPGRHFHDVRHLADVLEALAALQRAGNEFDPLPVTLAAWFRRSVYAGERDDDERSAVRAEEQLLPVTGPELAQEVARLIRDTETLRPEPGDTAAAALCDAALCMLKGSPEQYDEYVRDVRREYPHLSDEEFRVGRTLVVEGLVERPRIYHSEHGCQEWEAAARANLERELTALRRVAVPLQ